MTCSRLLKAVSLSRIKSLPALTLTDSNMSKNSFDVFIPLSTESEARRDIIYDFFDLLAAVSARGKTNGLGGRKLSRFAGWWAFEHSDQGKGFDGGYNSWSK